MKKVTKDHDIFLKKKIKGCLGTNWTNKIKQYSHALEYLHVRQCSFAVKYVPY